MSTDLWIGIGVVAFIVVVGVARLLALYIEYRRKRKKYFE